MLFAYFGPETMMPVASVIAATVGVMMMFGRNVVAIGAACSGGSGLVHAGGKGQPFLRLQEPSSSRWKMPWANLVVDVKRRCGRRAKRDPSLRGESFSRRRSHLHPIRQSGSIGFVQSDPADGRVSRPLRAENSVARRFPAPGRILRGLQKRGRKLHCHDRDRLR